MRESPKFFVLDGMKYEDTSASRFYARTVQWAQGILDADCYIMPNGKPSHEVAAFERDEAYDALIDFLCV